MRKTMFMIGIALLTLAGLCLPAQATELLRLEAHWAAVDGWEHCGKPVEGLLKVQGPAYVKRVSYEHPYTPLNFFTWDPVGSARVTREGDPRNDNPGVVSIYGKFFQGGKEVRNFRSTLLRREHLWHFTENEVYYFKVWIGSPCVRQSGGGQQRQDVLVMYKTQAGPDHIPESDIPSFGSPSDLFDGTVKPTPAEKPPVPGTQPGNTWAVNFNGYPGAMEISGSGGSHVGRFNLHGNWEDMLDLRIEGGRISFRRAGADQRYEGTILGNSMSGTFSQGGSGSYPWRADLVGGSSSSLPPVKTPPLKSIARTERWKVSLDPGPYMSTFELLIDADGNVDGVSHWTCCSGPVNRISGRITPTGDIQLTRHLEAPHTGMSHVWTGRYTSPKAIEGTWSSGSYGHGSGPWRAEVETTDGR
ncbi:MAG TPA: hypothetical protein VK855_10740 [Thioalkalivibrio sp.]|nr:hypothetical protein [Thioalkalivibrio sp.]